MKRTAETSDDTATLPQDTPRHLDTTRWKNLARRKMQIVKYCERGTIEHEDEGRQGEQRQKSRKRKRRTSYRKRGMRRAKTKEETRE